ERYLGFVRLDQDAYVSLPPQRYEVVHGAFDPQAAAVALAACTDCPPPARTSVGGVTVYSWGDDFATGVARPLQPPGFDGGGRLGRLAVTDQYVLRALSTASITAM